MVFYLQMPWFSQGENTQSMAGICFNLALLQIAHVICFPAPFIFSTLALLTTMLVTNFRLHLHFNLAREDQKTNTLNAGEVLFQLLTSCVIIVFISRHRESHLKDEPEPKVALVAKNNLT